MDDAREEDQHKSNAFSALVNILKTFAGAGTFALPWAMKQAGIVTGIIGIILVAIMSDYTMQLLVKARRYIQREGEFNNEDNDYWKYRKIRQPLETLDNMTANEVVVYPTRRHPDEKAPQSQTSIYKDPNDYIYDRKHTITYVDLAYEAMGTTGSVLTYVLLSTCNLGVCTVYLVFIAKLLSSMVTELDMRIWMLLVMPVLIPLSWIRTYKFMAPISFFGFLSLFVSLLSVIVYGFVERSHNMRWPWEFGSHSYINLSTLPLFFGIALFLFNTHTMVLPIEQSMKNRRWYGITLSLGFAIIVIMNLAFGILCLSFFGTGVSDDVTKDLPDKSAWVITIKSLLCAELILTYGVVLMPISELVIDQKVLKYVNKARWSGWFFTFCGSGLRTGLVFITLIIAEIFGSRFALVMSFIGGVSPNALGFIMPSLIYLILMRRKYGYLTFITNCFIIVIGFGGMAWNTYEVVNQLIDSIHSGKF
ncbi:solute carrier family 36 [Acrasis kona]|uniref:Solute carrier family 36 n=1 Tax=Acrasis kona TaxID=1008807 RepID=A0AAW2ZQY7_9EUKA